MKLELRAHGVEVEPVAPRAGAWIETRSAALSQPWLASPPARGRGLKRQAQIVPCIQPRSPPARGRGLKR